MNQLVRSGLIAFAAAMAEAGQPWQLGGSGLLYSLDLVDTVGDLDVVLPSVDPEPLGALLEGHTGQPADFTARQEDGFVSGFRGKHQWHGVELDLSSAVTLDYGDHLVRLPFEPGETWDLDGTLIPLAPVEQWLVIYRFHNPARALLLEPHVDASRWAALLEAVDAPPGFTGRR